MLSPVSTWMGDRLGTLDAVGFSFLLLLPLFWYLRKRILYGLVKLITYGGTSHFEEFLFKFDDDYRSEYSVICIQVWWWLHILEDSKSLKTRLQTIANFDFYPMFDRAKFPILLLFLLLQYIQRRDSSFCCKDGGFSSSSSFCFDWHFLFYLSSSDNFFCSHNISSRQSWNQKKNPRRQRRPKPKLLEMVILRWPQILVMVMLCSPQNFF